MLGKIITIIFDVATRKYVWEQKPSHKSPSVGANVTRMVSINRIITGNRRKKEQVRIELEFRQRQELLCQGRRQEPANADRFPTPAGERRQKAYRLLVRPRRPGGFKHLPNARPREVGAPFGLAAKRFCRASHTQHISEKAGEQNLFH